MRSKFKFLVDLELSNSLVDYSEASVTFSIDEFPDININSLNADSGFIGDQLSPKNHIKFINAYIYDAAFEDDMDSSSAVCSIIFEIESAEPITDKADMDYLAFCVMEDALENLKAHVVGFMYVTNDVAVPSISDMDYARREDEIKIDIDEYESLTYKNLPYNVQKF